MSNRMRRSNRNADELTLEIEGQHVKCTRLSKVLYPQAKFTKADVIDYYVRVAPFILPHLKDRPVTLKRYPDGVTGGRDTASLRAALTIVDVLVVPVLPATFDVWSLDPLHELILEAREINAELRSIVVLNAADPFGKDNEEAAAIIRETEDLEYFPHPIVRRKAFRNAAAPGAIRCGVPPCGRKGDQ